MKGEFSLALHLILNLRGKIMSFQSDLDQLFCSSEMLSARTESSSIKTIIRHGTKKLGSKKSAAYFRSIIAEPGRADLSVGEYSEFSMLHRRLRISKFVTDFSGLSLAMLREKAIHMEISDALRCL